LDFYSANEFQREKVELACPVVDGDANLGSSGSNGVWKDKCILYIANAQMKALRTESSQDAVLGNLKEIVKPQGEED
jgi:hypothetical protein